NKQEKRGVIERLVVDRAALDKRRDHEARDAHARTLEARVVSAWRRVRRNRERRDVIEEPSVLIVGDDEHRLRPPLGLARQCMVDTAHELLARTDRKRRMI